MALTSITVGGGVTVTGRLLARNGDVTLINDVVNASQCGANTTTPSPKAKFLGPCGEPFYAALFTNKTSAAVTFHWSFVSFYTHHVVHVSKTLAAGEVFQTSFHHVLGLTQMRITSGGHVLKSIRSAPPGNYGVCPTA